MKTYREKAEAYVRQQLPELAEWKMVSSGRAGVKDSYASKPTIALQHWFQILPDPDSVYKYGHNLVYIFEHSSDFEVSRIEFSLTTGQPASEADYQAFCEIVGIK